eukprot:gene10512-12438_t
MSYPDLVANATYYALVVSGYRSSIAASAGVSSSQVALVSVYAGSAAVDTTVSFSDSDLAAGSTPDALSTTLGDSGLLADVFAGSEVLGAYSNSVSASSVVTTAVTQTPTAVTRSPISADGISLPARAGPGLGTRIMEIAEQEKKRLDNERLGISEPAMLEVEAALEQLPAGPAAHAEEAEEEGDARMGDQGALHRRVTRQRRRTSLFRNLLSTGVTLGELDDPSPQSSLPADSAEPGNNRVADGAPGEGGCAAAELDKPPIADAAEPRTAVRHLATAAKATEVDKKDELCNPEVVGIDLRRVSVTLVPPLARPRTSQAMRQAKQVKERRASGTQNLGARGSLDAHLTPSSGPLQSHLAGAAAVVESYNRLQESPRSASPTGRSALLGAADQRIQESAFARKRQDPAGKDGKEVVKKAKKPTAEALFKSMSVNIYRLQLCIPLDYLETQALLEVQDDSRRHRLDATSAGSRGLTQVTSGGAAVPVMERLEQSSKLSGLLKHITVDSRAPGTAEKQAGGAEGGAGGKWSSWSMRALSLVNNRPSLGAGATCTREDLSKSKATEMWEKIRLRQRLPVERMLGTALVQAFLGIKALLSHKDLAEQAERASVAPWQMPNNRPFTWQRLEAVGCLDDVGHLPALVKGKEREGQGGMEEFKERMRYVVEHLQARNAAEKLSFWELGNPENAPRVRAKLRQFSRRVKRNLRWAAKAHPLTAIYLTNTYILMLTVTVWFYYSKSVTCCKSLRSHLECPNASDVREPCLGFGFCAALGTSGGMLPEELQAHEFVCTAFPDGTYTDRFFVIMIIIGILAPVTLTISQMFIIAA